MQAAISLLKPYHRLRLNHHDHHLHRRHHYDHRHILYPLLLIARSNRPMTTTGGGGGNKPGAFTTIKERVTFEREIKKSKFIAISGPISDERSAHSFLSEVRDPRATHNCWAYKVGDQYRSNDDGEPSGTAGKPIHSAIVSSGIDRVMVVVIRHFGGIKLGTGGLVRAYGGVAAECLKNAPTVLVKSKVPMGLEVPFDLLGVVYHQLRTSSKIMKLEKTISPWSLSKLILTELRVWRMLLKPIVAEKLFSTSAEINLSNHSHAELTHEKNPSYICELLKLCKEFYERIKNELHSSAGGGKDLRISFTDQVPCAFWLLLHSDLNEIRITSVLEDVPSMLTNITLLM
ncbi:hypothetical protein LOK49_LG08G01600 [Camellia lanceoleosa]|uniref:Uncharacterized protein n=1 Tax=Camellia lanceoleosa TaxID=1840588 RepID=A0ACC0GTG4_9ERIC|nr:hypothetical protein LOK49_LG08G01600 [Camellia lanceoleosa]